MRLDPDWKPRSKKQLAQELKDNGQGPRDPRVLADAITRRNTADGSLRGKLAAIAGTSTKTKSGVDVKTAAKKLGVTERTVQRWLKSEQEKAPRISKKHMATLEQKSRQTWSTKAGRQKSIAASPIAQKAKSDGMKFTISAFQGMPPAKYKRWRTVEWGMSPQDSQEFFNVWAEKGEHEAMNMLEAKLSQSYVPGFEIDSVAGLEFNPMRQGEWDMCAGMYDIQA